MQNLLEYDGQEIVNVHDGDSDDVPSRDESGCGRERHPVAAVPAIT
jgi:hypothetical protein